jgi:membrane associated rhomboid family serine protease
VFPLKDNIPTDHFPVVTVTLIALNVLAYFFFQHGTLTLGDPSGSEYLQNLFDYAYIPRELTEGVQCVPDASFSSVQCSEGVAGQPSTYLTVFTAMFMHGGLLHLGGNMLFLWIFGNNVEDSMGHVRFVIFYLLGGLAALGLQIAIGPNSTTPTLGASGAIAAVLGGYILIYPRARVLTLIFLFVFFTFIEIPAFFFLFIWFAQQALFGAIDLTDPNGGGGGVAYFAHVGGFVFGALAIKLFAQRRSAAYGQPKYPVY